MACCNTVNTSWLVVSHLCLLCQPTYTHCMQYDWQGNHNSEGWKLLARSTSQCKQTLVLNINLIQSRFNVPIVKATSFIFLANATRLFGWLTRQVGSVEMQHASLSFWSQLVTSYTSRGFGILVPLKIYWAFVWLCIIRPFTYPLVWPFTLDFLLGMVFPFTNTRPFNWWAVGDICFVSSVFCFPLQSTFSFALASACLLRMTRHPKSLPICLGLLGTDQ